MIGINVVPEAPELARFLHLHNRKKQTANRKDELINKKKTVENKKLGGSTSNLNQEMVTRKEREKNENKEER